ncbi:alpha/beta hydrolase-fold protein [Nocardia sp. NPDC048505]|uniref:alpha/beta hydrolase-fold protein n=1 Tax=unclassified Nocardia TaxID=2637762 RepID=UPI0033CFB39F
MKSPRLRTLEREIRADAAALERFWAELAASGAPLIEPVPGRPDERLVTVVWRETRSVSGVYVLANRVTDGANARRGMMRRIDGTDVWYASLRLPVGSRCSYRIHPFDADDPHLTEDGPRGGSARWLPDDRSDPLNAHANGPFGSMIELEGAPSLAEWTAKPVLDDRTTAIEFTASTGARYRLRRFVPADFDPEPRVLVVTDAERWFGDFGIVGAISAAVTAGRIAPTLVVGVEAGPPEDRMRQLGADPAFIDTLADEILPAVAPAPAHVTLCGQSLGGLTAVAAALWRPDAFDTVLAQSASTWWRPGMTTRPTRFGDGDTWLAEQAAVAPVSAVRIRMAVGANEGPMRRDLAALRELLITRGFDAALEVYAGGHDWCCWAAALLAGLAADQP